MGHNINSTNQDNEKPLLQEEDLSSYLPTKIQKGSLSPNQALLDCTITADSISTASASTDSEKSIEASEDDQKYTQKSSTTNYMRAMVIASGLYYLGYYYGIMNPMGTILAKRVFNKTTEAEIDNFNGNVDLYFCLGCNISMMLAGPIVDFVGRIRLIILVQVTGIILASLYMVEDLTVLYLLRGVDGVLSGLINSTCPIALAEMFPSDVTGFGGLFMYLSQTCFILLGWLTPLFFGNNQELIVEHYSLIFTWPVCFGVLRLALLLLFFKFGALESPGYFLKKLSVEEPKERNELETALTKWYSTVYIPEDVNRLVRQEMAKKEAESSQPSLKAMFGPKYRFRFFTGCLINMAQMASGACFLIFFSTNLFNEISHNGSTMTLVIGAANIFGGLIGIFTVEKLGRRFNMMGGCFLQAFGYSLLIVGYLYKLNIICVAAVLVYMIGFAVGLGGTVPIFTAEILPAAGVGVTLGLQWTTACITGMLLPSFNTQFGPVAMLGFFVGVDLFMAFFINYACIETKGLTMDEVDTIYEGDATYDGKSHRFSWFRFGGD